MSGNDPVVIELPGPVRGKGRHRSRIARAKDGRQFVANYPDGETVSYEKMLRDGASDAMDGRPLLAGPVLVKLLAVFAVPGSWSRKKRADALSGALRPTVKPDADNIMKLTDALNGIVWQDDKQVVTATLRKVYGERPYLRIDVVPIVQTAVATATLSGSKMPLFEDRAA